MFLLAMAKLQIQPLLKTYLFIYLFTIYLKTEV